MGASVGETPEVLRGCEEHTERLTAYQRRLMKDVAEMSIAMPHSHAMTPARLFTPRLGQSKVSSTQLHTMIHHQEVQHFLKAVTTTVADLVTLMSSAS